MTIWRYKIETAVYTVILDIFTIQSTLILQILFKLFIYVSFYRLPTVNNRIYITLFVLIKGNATTTCGAIGVEIELYIDSYHWL